MYVIIDLMYVFRGRLSAIGLQRLSTCYLKVILPLRNGQTESGISVLIRDPTPRHERVERNPTPINMHSRTWSHSLQGIHAVDKFPTLRHLCSEPDPTPRHFNSEPDPTPRHMDSTTESQKWKIESSVNRIKSIIFLCVKCLWNLTYQKICVVIIERLGKLIFGKRGWYRRGTVFKDKFPNWP